MADRTNLNKAHPHSPTLSTDTPPSYQSHPNHNDDEDDYTSSSGSSSENDSSSESEPEEDTTATDPPSQINTSIPNISGRPKPRIHRIEKDPDLLSRLSSFLPQMKRANDDLQREIDAGRAKELRLDEHDESEGENGGGRYIEMNLGLGVLEEKRDGDSESSDGEDGEERHSQGQQKSSESSRQEKNVLGKLMGKDQSESSAQKPSIQELNE